jgi:hypothetical protein
LKFGVDENNKIFLDGEIIPLLLPLVDSSDTNVWKNMVLLLSNICCIEFVESQINH